MKGCFNIVGLLLLLTTTIVLDVTNALAIAIPDKLRLNQHTGEPRTCSVIGGALHLMTRVALLGGPCSTFTSKGNDKFQIKVSAESNRAALQGKIQQVSIRVQDSKSPFGWHWLEVDTFEVEGSNLKLGWMPLILSAGIPMMLFLRPARRLLWTLSFYYYMWTLMQKLRLTSRSRVSVTDNNTDTGSSARIRNKQAMTQKQTPFDTFKKYISTKVGGEPSELRYTVVLSNDNLANSVLLKQCCKFLLKSLMQNSVLQTAATVGDAMAVKENNNRRMNMMGQNTNMQTNGKTNQAGELAIWQQQQQQQQQQQPLQQSNDNKLSKLLSATSFEMLKAPTFQEGKYLQFVSQAVLPDNQGRLDFVLRTKIQGGGMGHNHSNNNNGNNYPCLLQFVQPEIGFDVKEATSYLLLPNIVSIFLPKVLWLPVGSGIAIGGQSSAGDGDGSSTRNSFHSIQNVQLLKEGKCLIQGQLSFLQKKTSSSPRGLVPVRRN